MEKRKSRWGISMFLLLLLLAALFGTIYDYAVRNEQTVRDGIYRTMGEAAQQQLILFKTKLDDQFSQLEILADYAAKYDGAPDETLLYAVARSEEEYGFFGIGIIDARDGIAHLNSGESFDASGRGYFLNALEGERTIEYTEHGRLTGASIVVLAVPVYKDGAITAVLFASHNTESFAQLLSTTAYDGQTYSYITDNDGCIIVEPNHESAIMSDGCVFDILPRVTLQKGVTAEDVKEHMQSGQSFTFSFVIGSDTRYISFTPVGINDWCLSYVATGDIMSEQTSASSYNVFTMAIKMFLIFAAFVAVVWNHERANRRIIALKEEEYRIAAGHSNRVIMRYDIKTKTASYAAEHAPGSAVKRALTQNVPESTLEAGLVAEESVADYMAFYAAMRSGEPKGTDVFHMKVNSDELGWYRADYTLVGSGRSPRFAIISFYDVTKQREQELVYEKWRQSLRERLPEAYSLYHANISDNTVFDPPEGQLITASPRAGASGFDARAADYAQSFVFPEDRERFLAVMNRKSQLARYSQGRKADALEFREALSGGGVRWLKLSIDLMDSPYSQDVEAYLLFEDIDEAKRTELEILERAETDPLTGVFNRATFALKVDAMIQASRPGARHALLMLDIDAFKLVNDVFGHAAGDEALVDMAGLLKNGLRRGDLVGRLGGDEFVVFLADIPNQAAAAKKAQRICELARKALSEEVRISASVGVALYPQDGENFDTLYKKADDTLYYVKGAGKNNYAFYHDGMTTLDAPARSGTEQSDGAASGIRKRRMLIVDDSPIDCEILANMFRDEFTVDTCSDGGAALAKLRHYGSAISVVLLDLMMPGMDGFAVLEAMHKGAGTGAVPVIVVSGDDERETGLKAIRAGASDYITKPVDADILRIRVQSAVSKAENERLRAQNSFLALQTSELNCYQTALERSNTLVIVFDWVKGVFTYSPSISKHLSGKYDGRSLWQIFLADAVADSQTVQKMQKLVRDMANDRNSTDGSMDVRLRAADGDIRGFEMDVYKQINDFGLADKLIITLREAEAKNA